MASSEELQELIKLGPFIGLDETTAELYTAPGHALVASNINTQMVKGALCAERGRTEIFDAAAFSFAGDHIVFINIVYPCVGAQNKPGVLFQGLNSVGVLLTGYYDYTTGTFTNITNARQFTQAQQFKQVVYTNGGQRFLVGTDNTKFYSWQYPANGISQNVVVHWTYAIATTGFSGAIQTGDVLTTSINTGSGVQNISYTVKDTDKDFAILSLSVATAVNTYYFSGGGAADPNKVTASPFVNFDTAADPGSASPIAAQGVFFSSNARGNIGNTFTITVSMSAGAKEGYQTTGPTALGFFYGANVNVGNILGGTYFYIFTQTTTLPDGTVSETSAFPAHYAAPLEVLIGAATYGSNSAVTFTDSHGPPTYHWTGTNADGTTYTTNIYRASTNQAVFQYTLIGNQATNFSDFVDTQSDAQIAGNAVLTVHRDEPPFVTGSSFVSNLGFLCVHRNRLWALVVQDNNLTNNQAQVQLWYSNFDRAWEFNDVDQVMLLQSDVVVTPAAGGPNYSDTYGNMPRGLVEVGTTLIAFMHRMTWVVWGDDPPGGTNPFIQKPIFTYGACSQTGIQSVLGGAFFLSESGDLYFYDGSAPQYNSEDIRGAIKVTSLNPGLNADDIATACLSYTNRVLYVSFPAKQITYGFDTISNAWVSKLPYAPAGSFGVYSTPSNRSSFGGPGLNEVIAVRYGLPTVVDWMFSDPNSDVGSFMEFSWTTPHTDSGKPDYQKWYSKVRMIAPKQPGTATVSLTVDNGETPQQTFSCTFDLNQPQILNTQVLQGHVEKAIGYIAQVTLTVQGVAGQPSPVIWGVGIYGSLNQRLTILA